MHETKSDDLSRDFDTFMRAFDSFKVENDRRLADIEARGNADALTTEKLSRIDRALDELQLKMQRPALATSSTPKSAGGLAHKSAFDAYIRKGDTGALHTFELKALSASTNADGGYTVPAEIEARVNASLKAISPIRSIAGIREVSSSVYKKPFATSGFATGWVGETAARPETATPTLTELAFPTMELYAMPAASPSLLEDSAVDIEQWIADEVNTVFAEQEGTAFINGNGLNKPRGFLDYPKVANASATHGSIGVIATGVAGAFPATNAGDKLIDLAYAVNASYRSNGSFVMSRATQSAVRKLKDGQGNYLWQPAAEAGQRPLLMGYPVVEAEDMPDIDTDSHAIAFGDFKRGYLIVDRVGIRVLRDPYSSKPYVLFYTTKRVGGGIQDFAALKLLKFGV